MEQYESMIDIDLESGALYRNFENKPLGSGDENANRFGVRVFRNNVPEQLENASCVGFFIRPDNITLIVDGTVSGNEAYVELPEAAYAVVGTFTLAIKVSGTGFSNTLRIVDGTVMQTTTGSISDPTSLIPSLEELTAIIEDAEAAAAAVDDISFTVTNISGTRYSVAISKT